MSAPGSAVFAIESVQQLVVEVDARDIVVAVVEVVVVAVLVVIVVAAVVKK